jgi:thiosulfate/3-mercaptopyruvate sulfurtransferase
LAGETRQTLAVATLSYRFVDCRWKLGEPAFGRDAYLAGHIPGAVFVDVETELSGAAGPGGRHPLPAAETFTAAMGRAGIDSSVFVIAYGSLGGAERLWWLLRHFGHSAAAVIDLEAWRGPLTDGAEQPDTAARFSPRARADDTIELDELAARLDELVVLDARLPARFRGEPNPVDQVPGRLPGAVNSPWNEPLATLPAGETVVYCGSGITACVVLHQLALRGGSGRLYPGSWSEWEQHAELPKERG